MRLVSSSHLIILMFTSYAQQELEQHDVQELSRILFDAIESSLVGTAREKLTSELFHGINVQQVPTLTILKIELKGNTIFMTFSVILFFP